MRDRLNDGIPLKAGRELSLPPHPYDLIEVDEPPIPKAICEADTATQNVFRNKRNFADPSILH